MRSATDAAGLLPLQRAARLPGWCDAFLAPAGSTDFFGTRLWYDTILAHALPPEAEPVLARAGDALLLPLMRQGGVLRSLSTPYTLHWQPLFGPDRNVEAGAAALGRLLRGRAPATLDALPEDAPGLPAVLAGLRHGGLRPLPFTHFGNWWQPLDAYAGWQGYLAGRAPALRNTIQRKLARAARETRYELVSAPGPALEAGIRAYEDVRALSWKPFEPFPDFDAALMRAVAGTGLLRLGVLRGADGSVLAAQYWILSGGYASLLKLAHAEDARAGSPGTVLTALMIRGLIEQDHATALDFGRGDDAYKPLWVTQRRQRIGLLLADPLSPAGLLAIARQTAGHGRRQAMQWIERRRHA
jgi:CelD/BcsL family acetyltransferase involved in cellulose biosynthesis